MSKKTYVDLGAMMQRKDKDKEGNNQYYIKLGKDIKLNINGKPFNGQYLSVSRPEDKLKRFLELGYIDEEKFQERLEKIPEYIKFEITAVLED